MICLVLNQKLPWAYDFSLSQYFDMMAWWFPPNRLNVVPFPSIATDAEIDLPTKCVDRFVVLKDTATAQDLLFGRIFA